MLIASWAANDADDETKHIWFSKSSDSCSSIRFLEYETDECHCSDVPETPIHGEWIIARVFRLVMMTLAYVARTINEIIILDTIQFVYFCTCHSIRLGYTFPSLAWQRSRLINQCLVAPFSKH